MNPAATRFSTCKLTMCRRISTKPEHWVARRWCHRSTFQLAHSHGLPTPRAIPSDYLSQPRVKTSASNPSQGAGGRVDVAAPQETQPTAAPVDYRVEPSRYKHWRLSFEPPVATLTMDVAEDGGLRPGYKLKLNSYDLGVDIELHDALQRIRFEHPEIRSVVVTSGKERMFCAGANIYMLSTSSHAWKVNFCKFTNETRNGIEDASRHSGLKFIAAVNGACAGGGYEVALACDEIVMIDDRSTTVSLPEVPLLGVLPGTGGLTRLVDKRKVGATSPTSSAPPPTAFVPSAPRPGI